KTVQRIALTRRQAGDFAQPASPEQLAPNRQTSSLVVGEVQPSALQMLAQDPILRFQIVDGVELAPVDPTSEQQEQELERAALHGLQRSDESSRFGSNRLAARMANRSDRARFGRSSFPTRRHARGRSTAQAHRSASAPSRGA